MKKSIVPGLILVALLWSCSTQKQTEVTQEKNPNLNYSDEFITLTDTSLTDPLSSFDVDWLPDYTEDNVNKTKLTGATPLLNKLWEIAKHDAELLIIECEGDTIFGAGKRFIKTPKVFTRDFCYAGILGLNELYPKLMYQSIKKSRQKRREIGFKVPKGYAVYSLENVPWEELDVDTKEFSNKLYNSNGYSKRTDDAVWLWAFDDWLKKNNGAEEEYQWMYEEGKYFYNEMYDLFFDESDGLYYGQASFIDVHGPHESNSGYPKEGWNTDSCVMIHATSTNSLHYKGLSVMAATAKKLGYEDEVTYWQSKADNLQAAMLENLRFEDGTFTYFRHRNDSLQPRRSSLGLSLAILSGVAEGEDAKKAVEDYPESYGGVPIFHPFFPWKHSYHNNASWPFVDGFYMMAKEKATGENTAPYHLAMTSRLVQRDSTFHELVGYKDKAIWGSPSQLWSVASFVNACKRAGVYHGVEN